MSRSSSTISTLILCLSASGVGGVQEMRIPYPPAFLDSARLVDWTDVKDLSRSESAAYEALRAGRTDEARATLLSLRKGREDSVLVRKGQIDLDPSPTALRNLIEASLKGAKVGHRMSHADVLERGYALAMLMAYDRGSAKTADLPLESTVVEVRKLLNEIPTLAERVAAGEILKEISTIGEARRVLEEAARLAPRRAGVQVAYAWSLIHIGSSRSPAKPQEALVHALRAIREEPKRAAAYELAGSYYSMLGQRELADAQFRKFVQLGDPSARLVRLIRDDLIRRSALKEP